jgi:CRISPR-associated protein (TIGR02584 family)
MKTFKEIFVASVGITPQVITEAIYHYYKNDTQRIFERIVVVTTQTGKDKLIKCLINDGWLDKLAKKLGARVEEIPLTPESIVVLVDENGNPILDVRSSKDSNAELQQMYTLLRDLTKDDKTRLTVTIAGGRKSMSVALGLAMQFYGRDQDEMIHIMVPKERVNDKNWYFPTDSKDISQKIEVSQISYIRISKYLKGFDLSDPNKLMEIAQTRLNELAPIMEVLIDGNTITVEGKANYSLSPSLMMFWRYLARRKTDHCSMPELNVCGNCTDCYVNHMNMIDHYDQFIVPEYLAAVKKNSAYYDKFLETLESNEKRKKIDVLFDIDNSIRQYRSKLNTQLESKISDMRILRDVKPKAVKKNSKRNNYFGLPLDKNAIKFRK